MMTTETLEKMTVGYVVHGLNNSKAIAFKKGIFFYKLSKLWVRHST